MNRTFTVGLGICVLVGVPAWRGKRAEVASGVASAVGTGVLAIAWSTATAPLLAVLGARHVDQRLVRSGYRPRDIGRAHV